MSVIDSRHGNWEPMPGIPGFKRQLLRRDATTGATVELQYAPPGFSAAITERLARGAVRHYHRTVTERHYFLSGDLPNCDWKNLDDSKGELTVYRRHMFLDRPPLTLHGIVPNRVPETGSEYLVWNTGPGTALWEPEAARETVEVPEDAGAEWGAEFVSPRILQVDALPWHSLPGVAGWKRKTIASAVERSPQVDIFSIPPGTLASPASVPIADEIRWIFIIAGALQAELVGAESTTRAKLTEGGFLDLQAGEELRFEPGSITDQGCTLLSVGNALFPRP